MENDLTFRRILGLLADKDRFRILAAVSLGANTLEKIAAMTELDNAKIMKAIGKLETAGLIKKQEDAGYSFCTDTLRALTKNLDHIGTNKPKLSQLDRFIRDGKLITYPRSHTDQLMVLSHIVNTFEFDRQYPEKEVNEKLKTVNPDFAALRRYLVDNGFLQRDHITDKVGRTTTVYWRVTRQ
jgi:hypothetical protein